MDNSSERISRLARRDAPTGSAGEAARWLLRLDGRSRRARHPRNTSGSRKKPTRGWINWGSGVNGLPRGGPSLVGAASIKPL